MANKTKEVNHSLWLGDALGGWVLPWVCLRLPHRELISESDCPNNVSSLKPSAGFWEGLCRREPQDAGAVLTQQAQTLRVFLKLSIFRSFRQLCSGMKSRRETCSRLTAERCLLSPEGSLTEWNILWKVNWGQLSRWGVLLHEASIVTLAFTIISEYIIAWVIFVSVFSSNEFLLPWLEWRKFPGSHAVTGKKDWCSWVHTWPRRGLTGGTGPLLVLNNIPSHLLQAAGIWGMRP